MKNIHTVVILSLVIALLLVLTTVEAKTEYIKDVVVETVYKSKELTPSQIIWLSKLMDCESGIYAGAINPKDLDGTASLGILQFKPQTFKHYSEKYDIDADLMNADAQVQIVTHWILNPGEVEWSQQFPACTDKLGKPPVE